MALKIDYSLQLPDGEFFPAARRIPRDKGEYRGAQSKYGLTQTGKDAVALMLGLYRKAGRRAWRLRWPRKQNPKLSHRFNQSAEQAGTSRSERW